MHRLHYEKFQVDTIVVHGGVRIKKVERLVLRWMFCGVRQATLYCESAERIALNVHEYSVVRSTKNSAMSLSTAMSQHGSNCSRAMFLLMSLFFVSSAGGEELYLASPLTADNEFTTGIEGPACDASGMIYAVNLAEQGTIGRVAPSGDCEVAIRLPGTSVGNGIRFNRQGDMFIADYVNHNVFQVPANSMQLRVFAHNEKMNQPNDLTIAFDGTLYASDPAWGEGTGQLWRIDTKGNVRRVAKNMGTTNGIELSPDGNTLYVNESVQRNIWSFDVEANGDLSNKQPVIKFEDHGFDGMRCDVDGNLYVTRHGKGTVAKISPEGELLREINVLGAKPTNICFGGHDGRTAYVTEVEHRRIVQFRVDKPGLSWKRWQE